MSKKKKRKLKDDEPMPTDVQAQADVLDLQTPPPAPDPDMKDPDTVELAPEPEKVSEKQMDLFDDNHQIVDELEKFQQEITDQIAKAYDAILKKKIEIGILEGRRANIKEAIDMALALLGKEPPAVLKDEPESDAAATTEPLAEAVPGEPVTEQEPVPLTIAADFPE